jgi:hypothetical protein
LAGLPKETDMPSRTLQRATWISLSLGMTSVLVGCGDIAEESDIAQGAALASTNGLSMLNGLTMTNGLGSNNGLSMLNGLNSINGLQSSNGLMTTSGGRQTVKYLVRCALPSGRNLVKQDQFGVSHTFAGGLGLAPTWETGSCDSTCQQWLSACMLAHVNTAGINVPLYMVGQHANIGWGQSAAYPNQEGTFFGNIFMTNNVGKVDAYYCNGPGFDRTVVEGRLGANQAGAPYRNLFASKFCNIGGCLASDFKTNNVADGYKACTMGDGAMTGWNHMITVWRDNKAYGASGVVPGKTADNRTVRYDFEGNVSGFTSANAQLVLSAVNTVGGQTGSNSLKATYGSGASTLRISGPTGLALAAGTQVSFYLYLAADSKLTSINPFVKKQGGNEFKVNKSVTTLLKGSWNVVTITVPALAVGIQVGVEFQTGGAFTAHIDSVTW